MSTTAATRAPMSTAAAPRAPDGPGTVDRAQLACALAGPGSPVQPFRDVLGDAHRSLAERFRASEPVEGLVRWRARVIDQAILAAWDHFAADFRGRRMPNIHITEEPALPFRQ